MCVALCCQLCCNILCKPRVTYTMEIFTWKCFMSLETNYYSWQQNLTLVSCFFNFYFVFIWEAKTEIERGREPTSANLLFTCSQWLGLDEVEARSPEIHLGHPYGWQAPTHLSCNLVPPRVCISRRLELGVEPALEPRNSNMGCRHPNWWLNFEVTFASYCQLFVFPPHRYHWIKLIFISMIFKTFS